MTELERQLEIDVVAAARQRSPELMVLRLLKSALHNEKIAKQAKGDLPAADVIAVLRRELKKRQEAAAMYKQAGRTDLATKEEAEVATIAKYLPPAPSREAILQVMQRLKAEQGLSGQQALGPLTKAVLAHYHGAVDGQTVSRLAREILNQT